MHQSTADIEEENRIVEQARHQPEAFGILYEKYYREVYLFVFRRVDDAQTAHDLASQVFLKAMLHLHKYTFRGLPFSAWLYRIAANLVNAFYRHSHQSRVISIEDAQAGRLLGEVPQNQATDRDDLLAYLLNQLNDDEVALLELRFFEDRPFKEVAYILNITENNAKVKTYRILEKLRKIAVQL